MAGIEDQKICLYLNSKWEVIAIKSVREVFNEFAKNNCLGLNIEYPKDENGNYNFNNPLSISLASWEEWVSLPVRDCDPSIHTARIAIRIPTIVVSSTYDKMPPLKSKVSHRKIWLRDKGICQYTGVKLDKNTGNVDHVVPKKRGGKNSWTNLVLSHKDINSKKGSRTPQEAGLKLLREPKELVSRHPSDWIENIAHPDWNLFLKK